MTSADARDNRARANSHKDALYGSVSESLLRLVCRWRGHRWNQLSMTCSRCRRTALEIECGPFDAEFEKRVSDAYWRGVQDGRKIDRKRAYRLGYMRGGRSVFALVEEKFGV